MRRFMFGEHVSVLGSSLLFILGFDWLSCRFTDLISCLITGCVKLSSRELLNHGLTHLAGWTSIHIELIQRTHTKLFKGSFFTKDATSWIGSFAITGRHITFRRTTADRSSSSSGSKCSF